MEDVSAAAGRRGTNRAAIRVVFAGNGEAAVDSTIEGDGGYPPPEVLDGRVGYRRCEPPTGNAMLPRVHLTTSQLQRFGSRRLFPQALGANFAPWVDGRIVAWRQS
jgi:hypothetical protein